MIPLLAEVGFRSHRGRHFHLWLPLFLLWLLVLLLALPLLPLVAVVLWAARVNPFRALWRLGQTLCALRRTHVEIQNDDTWLLINLV